MRKRSLLIVIVLLIISLLPIKACASDNPFNAVMTIGETPNKRYFTWYSKSSSVGKFEIVKSDENFTNIATYNSIGEKSSNKKDVLNESYYIYKVEISKLEPNTKYKYRFWNNEDEKSDIMNFSTGNFNSPFSFIAVGDTQIGGSQIRKDIMGWQKALGYMKEINPKASFVLSLGDQVDDGDEEKQYEAYLNNNGMNGKTFAPAFGNHELAGKDNAVKNVFYEHFNIPFVYGDKAKGDAKNDYYYTYGNTLFMVLDISEYGNNKEYIKEHSEFIDYAIEQTKDKGIKWKVVSFHKSIYSAASHYADKDIIFFRNELTPIFAKKKIDVVFMGHDHIYTRSHIIGEKVSTPTKKYKSTYLDKGIHWPEIIENPDGVLYMTLNSSSGSKNYSLAKPIRNGGKLPYTNIYFKNQKSSSIIHISNITVTENSFKIDTYDVNNKKLLDSVTIIKK